MIQEAETERRLAEVVPPHVQLLNGIVHVMCQLGVVRPRPTSLVLVRRDVRPEALQRAEAVPGDGFLS